MAAHNVTSWSHSTKVTDRNYLVTEWMPQHFKFSE